MLFLETLATFAEVYPDAINGTQSPLFVLAFMLAACQGKDSKHPYIVGTTPPVQIAGN